MNCLAAAHRDADGAAIVAPATPDADERNYSPADGWPPKGEDAWRAHDFPNSRRVDDRCRWASRQDLTDGLRDRSPDSRPCTRSQPDRPDASHQDHQHHEQQWQIDP